MPLFYDFLFLIFSVLYVPYLLVKRKWHSGFVMRFGRFPKPLISELNQKDNIWVHAVSVGEVLLISRLAQNLKGVFPLFRIVISTVTQAGFEVAQKTFPGDLVIFAPLDFSFIVRRYIKLLKPKIYVAAETEIWPNLFYGLRQKRVPIVLVNGRLSDKAFRGYKIARPLLKQILSGVHCFCMQSESDAEKIKMLGADPQKIEVTGNMKFDSLPTVEGLKERHRCFRDQDIPLVAGSTHPGEEEILLDVYQGLSEEFPNLRLIVAPRHIERTEEVAGLIEKKGLKILRFSKISDEPLEKNSVVLVDTMGQLKELYAAAKLVFIGKSLAVRGGQNIIEPAFFAKPILIGPFMDNFKDITEIFLQESAIIQVKDQEELRLKLKELLKNLKAADAFGRRARSVVEKNAGATARTVKIISRILAAA